MAALRALASSPLLSRPAFLLCLSALLVHEMDAVREREWTGLFPFSLIKDDEAAHRVFTGVHVPLYAGLLWLFARRDGRAHAAASVLSAFAVGHAGAHAYFRYREWLGFRSGFSKALIWGAALCGAVDLGLARLAAARK